MTVPDSTGLVLRFFEAARSASSEGPSRIEVGASDIIQISQDAAVRSLFRDEYRRLNDPSLQELIKDYLGDVLVDLESGSERTEIRVDLIDRAGMVPAAGTLVAGIAALAASVATAPLMLLGGLAGVIISGLGRTYLRTAAQKNRESARKINQLRESL